MSGIIAGWFPHLPPIPASTPGFEAEWIAAVRAEFRLRTPNHEDLTDREFGALVVLGPSDRRPVKSGMSWRCLCRICRNVVVKPGVTLRNGRVRTCGSAGCKRKGMEWAE
jgi:hypothetical protein